MERIGSYFGQCTSEEMAAVDEALMVSLGIQRVAECGTKEIRSDTMEIDRDEYASLKSQLAVYKEICDKLLEGLRKGA